MSTNPFRDAAVTVEIGERARDELMGPQDWGEIIAIWASQQQLPTDLVAFAIAIRFPYPDAQGSAQRTT